MMASMALGYSLLTTLKYLSLIFLAKFLAVSNAVQSNIRFKIYQNLLWLHALMQGNVTDIAQTTFRASVYYEFQESTLY